MVHPTTLSIQYLCRNRLSEIARECKPTRAMWKNNFAWVWWKGFEKYSSFWTRNMKKYLIFYRNTENWLNIPIETIMEQIFVLKTWCKLLHTFHWCSTKLIPCMTYQTCLIRQVNLKLIVTCCMTVQKLVIYTMVMECLLHQELDKKESFHYIASM